jgi:hypothetical protein
VFKQFVNVLPVERVALETAEDKILGDDRYVAGKY